MTDARLRDLGRAAASGDGEARTRWLAERVRAGDLPRQRLTLAAFLGDEAARDALDGLVPAGAGPVAAIVQALAPWGQPVLVRAALAALVATRPVAPPWADASGATRTPRQAEAALVAWLRCPCSDHQAAVERVEGRPVAATPRGRWVDAAAADALRSVATGRVGGEVPDDVVTRAAHAAREAARAAVRALSDDAPGGEGPPSWPGAERVVRDAVRAALIPWALGEGDPLLG